MSLQLRRAEHADRDLLFGWANDDAVRANAFHTEKIPYEKHVVWFDKMMADASVHQYILCDGGTPVGQIRLNVEGSEAYVDYSIAADLQAMLAGGQIPHAARIVGQVKYGNDASARAFERCGFLRKDLPGYMQYEQDVVRGCY